MRHGDGTQFSFADGHGEYHKWEDPRTLEFGKYGSLLQANTGEIQQDNPDMVWSSLVVWGQEATNDSVRHVGDTIHIVHDNMILCEQVDALGGRAE